MTSDKQVLAAATKHVMTSDKQVLVLRSLEYLACYYITGSYMTQDYGYCTVQII